VSISFQVANELVSAAHEVQMWEEELVGVVLGFSIALTAFKSFVQNVKEDGIKRRLIKEDPNWANLDSSRRNELVNRELSENRGRSLVDFMLLFISIAVRISFSICVQLLASSARVRETTRQARIMTLLGLGVFFVWLESGSNRNPI